MQPYAPPPGGYGYPPNQQQPNPYAAPNPYDQNGRYRSNANIFVPPGARAGELPKPWIKKAQLACGVTLLVLLTVGFGSIIAGIATASGQHGVSALMIVGFCAIGLCQIFVIAYAIFHYMWLYQVWSWIPPEQRHTKMWKKYISPGMAVGFMFIPYFNIYWLFVIYLGIGDVLDRMKVQYPTSMETPRTLALVRLIVPMFFPPAGPFLDYKYGSHVERMATEMSTQMARRY